MTTTYLKVKKLQKLTVGQLLKRLHKDPSLASQYRKEFDRRIADGEHRNIYLLVLSYIKSKGYAKSKGKVESKTVNPYYGQIRYPGELHELATHMKRSGWECEGMEDPKEAYGWVLRATRKKLEWSHIESLPAKTQIAVINFWSAALAYWEIWQENG